MGTGYVFRSQNKEITTRAVKMFTNGIAAQGKHRWKVNFGFLSRGGEWTMSVDVCGKDQTSPRAIYHEICKRFNIQED